MVKKIVGVILLGVAVFVALVLFTYGGPVFPHIVGPLGFGLVGALLLLSAHREKRAE